MTTISCVDPREQLATAWEETVTTREPVIFSQQGKEPVVMLPLEEWRSMEETAYLLSSPANAKRLLGALERLARGEGESFTMEELREKFNLN